MTLISQVVQHDRSCLEAVERTDMKFGYSLVINRPLDEVFAVAGNPNNDSQWGSLIVESRQVSTGPLCMGTTFQQTAAILGGQFTANLEVTAYKPNRMTCYKTTAPIRLEHRRRFEAVPGGTQLT